MRTLTVAAIAALTLTAPPALADEPEFGCRFQPVQREDVAGSGYDVTAFGWVAHAGAEDVSITCSIEVNGVVSTWTPTGTGTGVATTTGRLVYSASETDDVRGCATATVAGHPIARDCPPPRRIQIPPQEVVDSYDALVDDVDSAVCGVSVVSELWGCPPA